MGSNPASLRFFECPRVGTSGSLEQILDVVQDSGFKVSGIMAWRNQENDVLISEYYDQEALEKMNIAYGLRHLGFFALDRHSEIVLYFDINWTLLGGDKVEKSWILATAFETAMFTAKDDAEHHAQRFLHLGERLYQATQPQFGWIERGPYWRPETTGYTTWHDVEKLKLSHVYWANFFGPAYVNKLGQEFLMQAPGWKHEGLDDGGLLYVLTSSLAGTGPVAVVREVQSYFGVEHVRRRPRKGRKRSKK